jgi:hypothetical protein
MQEESQGISWTASEYIAHHKSSKWYISLGVTAVVLAILVWLLTKDEISAGVVVVGAAVLGAYGSRPPQELPYTLDQENLSIGPKSYRLQDYRSFSVDDQQAFSSVNLVPLKRFAPGLTIYYAPEDETAIIDILASVLPMEPHVPDMIDRLMHRIRF